jgi:hypothetical protein
MVGSFGSVGLRPSANRLARFLMILLPEVAVRITYFREVGDGMPCKHLWTQAMGPHAIRGPAILLKIVAVMAFLSLGNLARGGQDADTFQNWNAIADFQGLTLERRHPSVPLVPQIRLSPEDLNFGLPESVGREYREKMARTKADIPGRAQVGEFMAPQQLIATWTVNAPYLRKPYFPNLLRLHNGDLLAFYSEGKGHGDFYPYGRGVMVRSRDEGKTWSAPAPVPNEEGSAHLGFGNSAYQTRDGMIWVTVRNRSARFVLRSADNGVTWSKLPLPEDVSHLDPVLEMSNGEFLWLGYVYTTGQASDAVQDGKVPMLASAILRNGDGDDPSRWQWEVRTHQEFGVKLYDEESVAETGTPGHLVMLIRIDALGQYYVQSDSFDFGQTWSAPRSSGIWQSYDLSRPHLISLADGTLVCAYAERGLGRVGAAVSFDEGRTWDYSNHLVALDSPAYLMGDFAYCKVAPLPDDKVLLITYNSYNLDPGKIGLWGEVLDIGGLRQRYGGVQLAFNSHAPLDAETRGFWDFNESGGEVLHEALDREHGLIFGATRGPGRLGRGLNFDGHGGYAAIADHPSIQVDNTFTLEAWVQTDDPQRPQAILAKRPRYYLGIEDSRLVFAYDGAPQARGKQTLEANRWYHVALVYKPNPDNTWMPRICFFLDGQLDACGKQPFQMIRSADDYAKLMARNDWRIGDGPRYRAVTTQQTGPTERLFIGIDSDAKSHPFAGKIDEIAIHNGALSDQEIALHAKRHYLDSGEVTSVSLTLPAAKHWDRFQAEADVPAGTSLDFDLLDAGGKVILGNLQPGSSLSSVQNREIRLRATLHSAHGDQTPTLRRWEVTWQ